MSFRLKTILGVAFIEVTLLLFIVVQAVFYLRDSTTEQLMNRARTTVNLSVSISKDAVLSYDLASMETFLEDILANPGILYGRIIGVDGEVLSQKGEGLDRVFQEDHSLDVVEDGSLDVSAPILVEEESFGQIEMGFSTQELKESIEDAGQHIAGIAVLEVILSGLFSALLGGLLTRRLSLLKQASERLAMGDFNVKVDFVENDEIGQVGKTFDLMVHNLKEGRQERDKIMEDLWELNTKLEDKVSERTSSLEKSNRALAQEKAEQAELIQELESTRRQLVQSEKMASIGQLSAGIAHEINNPVGFILSNMDSLKDSFQDLLNLEKKREVQEASIPNAEVEAFKQEINYDFLVEDIGDMITETAEGAERVRHIVSDLKEYSHFGGGGTGVIRPQPWGRDHFEHRS